MKQDAEVWYLEKTPLMLSYETGIDMQNES
jgi:hypothetical protein